MDSFSVLFFFQNLSEIDYQIEFSRLSVSNLVRSLPKICVWNKQDYFTFEQKYFRINYSEKCAQYCHANWIVNKQNSSTEISSWLVHACLNKTVQSRNEWQPVNLREKYNVNMCSGKNVQIKMRQTKFQGFFIVIIFSLFFTAHDCSRFFVSLRDAIIVMFAFTVIFSGFVWFCMDMH